MIKIIERDYTTEAIYTIVIGWPEYNLAGGEARIATGDIDGDLKDEIIIGLGPVEDDSSMPAGRFQILDDDYSRLAWGQIGLEDYNRVNGETWPACGDLDGDNKDEIIMGLGSEGGGWLEVFDYKADKGIVEHKKWIQVDWDDYNTVSGETRPACGNLDQDWQDEIIVGLGSGGLGWMGVFDDARHEYASMPNIQFVSEDYNLMNGESRPAIKGMRLLGWWTRETLKVLRENMLNQSRLPPGK